jgi:hypothetical protein
MLNRTKQLGKRQKPRFASPRLNSDHPRWKELDSQLPVDHVARTVVAAMENLDLEGIYECYTASGSPPTNPLLMLRIVLIEMQCGRFRPDQWYRDTLENDGLKWAGFGIQPSRTAWYNFHDRIAEILPTFNAKLVAQAVEAKVADGSRISLDGSTVEANASRHRLVNDECLTRRQEQLDAACAKDADQQPVIDPPSWMAKTPITRENQRLRFEKARQRLEELHAVNNRQDPGRRRESKKIVVSTSDPDAALGRDKFNVFRPLYNIQLVRDVNSQITLASDVVAQPTDAGMLKPMLQRLHQIPGIILRDLLVDSSYVTACNLSLCEKTGVTLYGPWQENDYSAAKKGNAKEKKMFEKERFTWQADKGAYVCPQGHLLNRIGHQKRPQSDGEVHVFYHYRCSPKHCSECPLKKSCTTNPNRGRSVKRSEHELLVEAHRQRMATDEAKEIYKYRKQTVELGFADMKQHRLLRRFPRRGLSHARTHLGLLTLVHNLLVYNRSLTVQKRDIATLTQAA